MHQTKSMNYLKTKLYPCKFEYCIELKDMKSLNRTMRFNQQRECLERQQKLIQTKIINCNETKRYNDNNSNNRV